jgi:hypothetical protein
LGNSIECTSAGSVPSLANASADLRAAAKTEAADEAVAERPSSSSSEDDEDDESEVVVEPVLSEDGDRERDLERERLRLRLECVDGERAGLAARGVAAAGLRRVGRPRVLS